MGISEKLNIYLKPARSPEKIIKKIQPPRIGYIRQTDFGDIWIVDWEYSIGDLHGRFELNKSESFHRLLDSSLGDFNLSRATVIDTETTGLAGGTGTYAFIIGAGFWKDDKFIVKQYMMRDFNEELAQLNAFAEDLTKNIITYNGKCFDIPLLKNRFRLHRMDVPFDNMPHLDMLFPSRRIWKRSLTGFKLMNIEERILGYARDDDIPSHLIPSIFFDYLQNRDEEVLYPILNHNRDDIISLYHIAVIASDLVKNNITYGSNDDNLLLSLAEIFFNTKYFRQAIVLLDKINQNFASKDTMHQALCLKALACKKLGRWKEAKEVFLSLYEIQPDYFSSIELAKLYEHRLKEPHKALEIVSHMEMLMVFEIYSDTQVVSRIPELQYRKLRLKRKISRLS